MEVGKFEGPLERFLLRYQQEPESDQSVELLKEAILLAGGPWSSRDQALSSSPRDLFESDPAWKARLTRVREHFRRELTFSPDQVETYVQLAEEAGEESHLDWYAMMEVVQPTAVAASGLTQRTIASGMLAYSAKCASQFERARQAYADALEGLEILSRFSLLDADSVLAAQRSTRHGFSEVKNRSDRELEPFEPASADPSEEWMQLLLWNTDFGAGQGLLAQVDAALRLAIRFEDWLDRKGESLDSLANRMLEMCFSARASEDTLLPARYAVTLGDALVEVRQWALAGHAFRRVSEQPAADMGHPLWLHASIQEAYCALMADDAQRCCALLATIDEDRLDSLAGLVVTVGAEFARYVAVQSLSAGKRGATAHHAARKQIAELTEQVRVIVPREVTSREESLRTLFFAVLARDLQYMLANV